MADKIDNKAPAFKPTKATHVLQLRFEGAWVTAVAFLGSHKKLAAANRLGQLFVWDLSDSLDAKQQGGDAKDDASSTPPSADPSLQLEGHVNSITRLAATRDGQTLVSTSLDRTARIWTLGDKPDGFSEVVMDRITREQRAKKERKDDALKSPGIKVSTLRTSVELGKHADWINGLGLSGDDQYVITGDDQVNVTVWDRQSRKPVSQWKGHPGDWVTSACLSADGKTAFVAEYCSKRGDFDRPPAQARLYDAETGEEKIDLLKVQFPNVKNRDNSYGYATTWGKFVARGFVASAFSPDGKLLALGQGGETGTGKVHLIDTGTGKLVRSVSGHKYGVTDLQFSADGLHVISVGRDTMVRICQVADGKEVLTLGKTRGGQFKDWLHAVSLSPDQQWIAAADMAGYVHVWRIGES